MSPTSSPKSYRLKIPSIPEKIAEVDEYLESTLKAAGIEKDTVADIAIAVTEVVNNAIDHGNAADPEKSVTLEMTISEKEIAISIADEGGGFNPEAVDDPLAKENLLKEVGRGIFIVRHLMDTVSIDSVPGQGTTVRITKALNPSAS